MKIEVYCDGSSNGKTGAIGGWAFVVVIDGVKNHEDSGKEANATNNTMELRAAINALEYVAKNYPQCTDITLISDSQLALNYANGTYRCKKPHLVPFYCKIRQLHDKLKITTKWERGHSGEPNNERCDQLAKAARES
jgi:ribonuclease HI